MSKEKKALVLLNMGGPSNLDEVPLFLSNMFNDKYIIPIPFSIIRSFVAKKIVKKRYKSSQENYKKIGGKSPLLELTKKLAKKIEKNLDLKTFIVMRYTPPFAKDIIKDLISYSPDEIILFPMYPQYSMTTTKSSLEDVTKELKKAKLSSNIRVIEPYFNNEYFLNSVVETIKESIVEINSSDYILLFSAHALPQNVIDRGDPYRDQIETEVELIKEILKEDGIIFEDYKLSFQSRLGSVEWTKPYLSDSIKELANKKVLIVPISFTVDNLETDFELSIEYKEIAKENNVSDYRVCRSLNDRDSFINAIASIIK